MRISEEDNLHRHEGALEPGGEYHGLLFYRLVFDAVNARNALFSECAFSSVALAGGAYRRSKFGDVLLRQVQAVGTDLVETEWLDAVAFSSAFSGVEAFSTRWRRVVFTRCKLDSVNFRGSQFSDVVFEDCIVRDADFTGSALSAVTFPGSALQRVRFANTKLAAADFRGATELDFADGHASLRGAIIDSSQLMALAPALAAAAGILVKDD